MIWFERRRNTSDGRAWVKYPIYTQEEADEKGIEYMPWRKAPVADPSIEKRPQLDEHLVDRSVPHVLDDFGYVSGVYDGIYLVNESAGQTQVNFVFGRRYASKKHFGYGHPRMTSNFPWQEKESRRERVKRTVVAYVQILMQRSRLTEEDWQTLGRLYRPDDDMPVKSVKRILKQTTIKKMIREEIARTLQDAGVTPKDVIQGYEDLRKRAKDDGAMSIEKGILDKYVDLLDMKPNTTVVQGGVVEGPDLTHLLKGGRGESELSTGDAPIGLLEDPDS